MKTCPTCREEPIVPEASECCECHRNRHNAPHLRACSDLREVIKRDIQAIASIYPSAFDLYDEPLERLVGRIARTVEKHNTEHTEPEHTEPEHTEPEHTEPEHTEL